MTGANEVSIGYHSFEMGVVGLVDECSQRLLKVSSAKVDVLDADGQMLVEFGMVLALFLEDSHIVVNHMRQSSVSDVFMSVVELYESVVEVMS